MSKAWRWRTPIAWGAMASLCVAAALWSCGGPVPPAEVPASEERTIPLVIAFLDGFTGDEVRITAAEKELYRNESLTTDLMRGYADSVEVEVPPEVTLVVSLPQRGMKKEIPLKLSEKMYLGIAIREGQIVYRLSTEPFTSL